MSVLQTVLIYVLIPAAIYGVIALLTLWSRSARLPRYRPGQAWTYEPVWWSASGVVNTGHVDAEPTSETTSAAVRTARGGARGNW